MIFRLDGNVEEVLALTPVMREWKVMTSGKVWADTFYPELFIDNPYVDGIVINSVTGDCFSDFNSVNWQSALRPVVESFAEFLLGKNKLYNWHTIMYHTPGDEDVAEGLISNGKIAIVAERINKDVDLYLKQKGYDVFRLSGKDCGSWNVFHAVVSKAGLYIGFDGNDTAIALTTNVPAVVIYSYRSPVYFAPFRRGIPFEAITPTECIVSDSCLMSNGFYEAGKTYGVKCSKKETFCKKEVSAENIIGAVERVLEKA
jgi:hypothetical protein